MVDKELQGIITEAQGPRFRPWLKVIALFVAFCMFYQSAIWAVGSDLPSMLLFQPQRPTVNPDLLASLLSTPTLFADDIDVKAPTDTASKGWLSNAVSAVGNAASAAGSAIKDSINSGALKNDPVKTTGNLISRANNYVFGSDSASTPTAPTNYSKPVTSPVSVPTTNNYSAPSYNNNPPNYVVDWNNPVAVNDWNKSNPSQQYIPQNTTYNDYVNNYQDIGVYGPLSESGFNSVMNNQKASSNTNASVFIPDTTNPYTGSGLKPMLTGQTIDAQGSYSTVVSPNAPAYFVGSNNLGVVNQGNSTGFTFNDRGIADKIGVGAAKVVGALYGVPPMLVSKYMMMPQDM